MHRSMYAGRAVALLKVAVCAGLALQFGACTLITDLDRDRSGARMLERRVARPAWAPDGRAIYYAGSEGGSGVTSFTINAVDVESGRARSLASLTGWNTGGKQVRTSVDPSVVYFAIANTDGSLQYTVYRVPSGGGTIEALATNVGRPWFVISRSGNRVSYQAPRYDSDTIQVLTLSGSEEGATLSIPTAVNLPRVLAISPDGAIVVYGDDTAVYGAPVDGGAHLQL
ncbi:MAG: TolB family protein, partial [Longimicrobiales bacterium]